MTKRKKNPGSGLLWGVLALTLGGGIAYAVTRKRKKTKAKKSKVETPEPDFDLTGERQFDNGITLAANCTTLDSIDFKLFKQHIQNFAPSVADTVIAVAEEEQGRSREVIIEETKNNTFSSTLLIVITMEMFLIQGTGTATCMRAELSNLPEQEVLQASETVDALALFLMFWVTQVLLNKGFVSKDMLLTVLSTIVHAAPDIGVLVPPIDDMATIGFPTKAIEKAYKQNQEEVDALAANKRSELLEAAGLR